MSTEDTSRTKPAGIVRASDVKASEQTFAHPWNPLSEITGVRLSQQAGLQRAGVSIARVMPGKESFAYHAHHREEEWIYVLSGRGRMRIDGEETEVGPGDFIGFPTPSVAHNLSNPFDQPVVYLMGGESKELEIADFPDLDRRMLRLGDRIEVHPLSSAEPAVFEPPAETDGDE